MNTWYEYREAWAAHRWILAYAIIVVLVLLASIVGTIAGGPFALLFVPGLAGLYVHHLIVMKKAA